MGVGIFAARKIALLNSINNLEMMITQLSSQQMTLSDEAAQVAMQQNSLKMNCATGQPQQGGNVWGAVASGVIGGVAGAVGGINPVAGAITSIAGSVGDAIGQSMGGSVFTGNFNPAAQSAKLDNKLIEIQQKEKRLQVSMKRLESQLAMKNREYESVEKGEQKAIERSTPKFT